MAPRHRGAPWDAERALRALEDVEAGLEVEVARFRLTWVRARAVYLRGLVAEQRTVIAAAQGRIDEADARIKALQAEAGAAGGVINTAGVAVAKHEAEISALAREHGIGNIWG